MEITEDFQYLRVSSDERELALHQHVFTRTWCCTAGSRWPVSPQLEQHQSLSPRLQMSAERWCAMARVLKVYLGTTCLLVSQCYCEHFCQDTWNGERSLRLHTQLFPGVPSNTAAGGFSLRFQTLRPCCSRSSQFLKLSPQQQACKRSLCAAPPLRESEKSAANFGSLHACERWITL